MDIGGDFYCIPKVSYYIAMPYEQRFFPERIDAGILNYQETLEPSKDRCSMTLM